MPTRLGVSNKHKDVMRFEEAKQTLKDRGVVVGVNKRLRPKKRIFWNVYDE
jgi:hypothetical protein